MATPTMHFGPEWMRPKQTPSARNSQPPPSPPVTAPANTGGGPGTYSSLVSPTPLAQPEQRDQAYPFRYSKDDMLKIFKESGRNNLGLEVERWEGIVRDIPNGPVSLHDMSENEKKLFTGSLNSEIRRRQSTSTDLLSPLSTTFPDRPRLAHNSSTGPGSPLRERFGSLSRRKDSADPLSPIFPRKNSLSTQPPLMSPRDPALPSPRTRSSGFDGVLNSSGDSWISARRRASEARLNGHSQATDSVPSSGQDLVPHVQPPPEKPSDVSATASATEPVALPSDPPVSELGKLSMQPTQPGPPAAEDLSAIEWSYVDPSGAVQGPFKADLMQSWNDQGYFTENLLMKRTHIDTTFVPLHQLRTWGTSDKLFLSPLAPPNPPPGLPPLDHDNFNGPYQPSPVRSLRHNPLDAFGSISNPSDSPASSFGARGFNGSPDPSAFGGRAAGSLLGSGDQGINGHAYPNPDPFTSRKSSYSTGFDTSFSGSPLLGNIPAAARDTSLQSSRWGAPQPSSFASSNGTLDGQTVYGSGYGLVPQAGQVIGSNEDTSFVSAAGSFGQPLYNGASQAQTVLTSSPAISHAVPASVSSTQSPWDKISDTSSSRRLDPFTPSHPTAYNAASVQPSPHPQQSTWDSAPRRGSSTQLTENPASWFASSQGALDQGWKEEETGPNSLTVDNLGQHNLLQQRQEEQAAPVAVETATAVVEEPEPIVPSPIETPPQPATPAPAPPAAAPPKQKAKKSKESKPSVPPVTPAPVVQPESSRLSSSPATATTPKTPWGNQDEAKKPASLSLREIQEAEKKVEEKKAQARKAEQDKVRAAQTTASAADDGTSFTAAWGLPTSQAGNRNTSPAIVAKDVPTSQPATPPVWNGTTSNLAPKKTMKEIQEEEERRRKAVSKETTASIASRRTPAEPSKPQPIQGGVWTTVGPAGKPAARPPTVTATSTSTSVPRANGAGASRPAVSAPKPAPPAPKVDDTPVMPSADFVKWLSEALRGLSSSANIEDIMSMLLAFPVDPDDSTKELISDLVYAHSTTMDGRRFATDFVTRRKADAASVRKGGSTTTKPVSIADVVKAQPKPTQPEWGGFKVVNKKKKGGKA